jgi:hypothetical protein
VATEDLDVYVLDRNEGGGLSSRYDVIGWTRDHPTLWGESLDSSNYIGLMITTLFKAADMWFERLCSGCEKCA